MVCHNTIKNLPIQHRSMSLRKKSGWLNTKTFRMRLSHSKRRRQVRQWQVENMERTQKDKFSQSRYSMRYVLQCNIGAKD